jgi:predicted nucleic acid-binding protein
LNLIAADTGPLNYLIQVGCIGHLPTMFGKVAIPIGVAAEIKHPGAPEKVRDWTRQLPDWIETRTIDTSKLRARRGLSEVDLQVLALGLELEGPILPDDLGLRSAASEAGLKVIGTLGILELASARKLVNLREVLIRLKQTTIRLADRFYDEALARESLRAGNR